MKKIFEKLTKMFSKKEFKHTENFEVIEKSREHKGSSYYFKAVVKLQNNNVTISDIRVIVNMIQEQMGFHPIGYPNTLLESNEIAENVFELTWRSWDSCD